MSGKQMPSHVWKANVEAAEESSSRLAWKTQRRSMRVALSTFTPRRLHPCAKRQKQKRRSKAASMPSAKDVAASNASCVAKIWPRFPNAAVAFRGLTAQRRARKAQAPPAKASMEQRARSVLEDVKTCMENHARDVGECNANFAVRMPPGSLRVATSTGIPFSPHRFTDLRDI